MGALLGRVSRACFLDLNLFDEVRDEKSSTSQALLVIFLSSLSFGLGSYPFFGAQSIIFSTLFALIYFLVWAALVYLSALLLFSVSASKSALMAFVRTAGFASSPGVLRIFCFLPLINIFVLFLSFVLSILSMNLALRSAFSLPKGIKPVLTVFAALLIALVLTWYFFKFLDIPIPFAPRVM